MCWMPLLARCVRRVPSTITLFGQHQWLRTTQLIGGDHETLPKSARHIYASASAHQASKTTPPLSTDPKIDTRSLKRTLKAHRDANRTSLIHKVYGKGLPKESIQVPLRSDRRRGEGEKNVRRVALKRLEVRRGSETRSLAPGSAEYSGRVWPLSAQWRSSKKLSSSEMCPWVAYISVPTTTGLEHLTAEILAFSTFMGPNRDEKAATSRAMSDILACIQCAAPTVEIDVVGSQATGLALPLSDIDVNVLLQNKQGSTRSSGSKAEADSLLRYLAKEMRSPRANFYKPEQNPVRVNLFLWFARVPIIVGVHVPTGLEFQIQSSTDCYGSMEHTKDFVAEYPTLRPLFVVIKQLLSMRGLTKGSSGGLTTYPLIAMIVAALKLSEGKIARHDAGKQLLFFFDMYSEIDFYKNAISICPLRIMEKRPSTTQQRNTSAGTAGNSESHLALSRPPEEVAAAGEWVPFLNESRPFLMSLQDPADSHNDLGRGVHLIKHVQATIVELRGKLNKAVHAWDQSGTDENSREPTNLRTPILAGCLGGDYTIFQEERRDLRKILLQGTTGSRSLKEHGLL